MNTEIVLKDYSELSIMEKLRIALVLPKYFQIIEESHMIFSKDMEQSEMVTARASLLEASAIVANLMSFYNSENYQDFTVINKTVGYLQEIKQNSRSSRFEKESARLMLNQLIDLLPPTVFQGV